MIGGIFGAMRRKGRGEGMPGHDIRYVAGEVNDRFRRYVRDREFHQPRKELLRRETRVFAMGSCFANEIRDFLLKRGVGVMSPTIAQSALSLFHSAAKEESSWGEWDGRSNLQYYNSFAIRQEVEKAAGLWTQAADDYWEVVREGIELVQCPYRRRIFCDSADKLRDLTRAIDQAMVSGFSEAEVVIFTLGLTEVWRKRDNGRVACCEPGYCKGGGHEETEFLASTYEDNYSNVKVALEVLREHFGEKRVVLTVSPVPLGRTFRPLEVAVANSESKSILRAVAGRIDSEFDNVTYFPSYEMCVSDPQAYKEDGRHIRPEKVSQIMSFFLACHGHI